MGIEKFYKLLGKKLEIRLKSGERYTGYADYIVIPEEDEDLDGPILVLDIEGRNEGTIDGFFIDEICSAKIVWIWVTLF